MSEQKKYAAVFFDLGGTLYAHLRAALTTENLLNNIRLISHAPALEETELVRIYNQHRRQVDREMLTCAFYMHRRLVAEAFERTLRDAGLPQPRNIIANFCDGQAANVIKHLTLRSDTEETLARLRTRHTKVAIVSNIDDNYIVPLLDSSGLKHAVDYWISSERARSCKPHAHIFQQALTAMNLLPEDVLFVGDSYVNDVVGPKRLGMASALLTVDISGAPPGGADYEITSLSEIVDLTR
jgi:HAD superfamily hydrolase (TIGR01509 family)